MPGAADGFRLLFSPAPFPGYTVKLEWRRKESGGNWYFCQQLNVKGWLCPALLRYFEEAPSCTHGQDPERDAGEPHAIPPGTTRNPQCPSVVHSAFRIPHSALSCFAPFDTSSFGRSSPLSSRSSPSLSWPSSSRLVFGT